MPEPRPLDDLPEPVVFDSPDTPTIATLVALANERHPRADGRDWTAADTLKNVVLALDHLDGRREVVIVGVPGDRDIDLKRAEVAFAPAAVEPATEKDFLDHPLLVKGYIGPWSRQGPVLGGDIEGGPTSATSIRTVGSSSTTSTVSPCSARGTSAGSAGSSASALPWCRGR